jgi:hypothetical protein
MKNKLKLFRIGGNGSSVPLAYISGNLAAIEHIRSRGVPRSTARDAIRSASVGLAVEVNDRQKQLTLVKWMIGGEAGESSYDVHLSGVHQGMVWGLDQADALLRAQAVYSHSPELSVTLAGQMEPVGVSI